MADIWLTDERTGIDFQFQAYWVWEDVGIGWYDFHGSVEYDNTKKKVIKEIDLVGWDAISSEHSESEGYEIKLLGEQCLVDNYEEIERQLYEIIEYAN